MLVLVMAFACMAYGPAAGAQTYRCTSSSPRVCDEGEAYAEAQAYGKAQLATYKPPQFESCVKPDVPSKAYAGYVAYTGNCFANVWISSPRTFYYGDGCSSRPDWNGPYPYLTGGKPRNGSVTCNGGCRQAWYSTGDGYFVGKYSSIPGTCDNYDEDKCKAQYGMSWNSAMSACEPDEGKCPDGSATNSLGQCAPEPCPPGKIQQADGTCKNKNNECPAGQIKSPDGQCLPGDGQCAKGEARGKDGTCKKDNDGDGKPDEEDGSNPDDPDDGKKKEEFSGGDNCTTPPSCSGSPILCGQARIQWRIDCNTRKNRNIAGGMCTAQPVCTGDKCDALEYSSLLMQWRIACATEKLAGQGGNGSGESGQPEWTKVGSMSQDPGSGSSAGDTKVLTTKKLGVSDLDQSGVGGGGGQCIGFASGGGQGIASGFTNALASPPGYFCDYISTVRAIII
ncbi:MAG: hypothetical protein ACRES5_08510, partial [Pseudomonas sp.]